MMRVFKNNYIQKLAFDNIKKQKSLYRFVFIALTLAFFLTTLSSILFTSFEEIGYKERYERYGKWSVAIENPTQEQEKIMKANDYMSQQGYVYQIGNVEYQDIPFGQLNSIDSSSLELIGLEMVEGRLPSSKNEIAIEEDQLIALGLTYQLNQKISLQVNQETIDYQLVGIIKNYSQSYPIPLSSFITAQTTSSQYTILYNSQNHLMFWNQIVADKLYEVVQFNHQTYNQYSFLTESQCYIEPDHDSLILILIAFIGFSGVLGTMISSMGKREEHLTLMRAIGATYKQIQKLVIYEGFLLTFIAGLLGIILGLCFSFIVLLIYQLFTHSEMIFSIKVTLFVQLGICIIVCGFGIIFPSWNVYFIPLIGKISQQNRFQKVRKVRKTNLFILALREVTQHKIITTLLICIIAIGIGSGFNGANAIDSYFGFLTRMENQDSYDYELKGYADEENTISENDILELQSISGISTQVVHSHSIGITWDQINQIGSEYNAFNEAINQKFPYTKSAYITYYEDEQALNELLEKYHYQGQYPSKDNEVIIVKPHFATDGKNGEIRSRTAFDDLEIGYKEYFDQGLDIGNQVQVINQINEQQYEIMKEPFQIVGTISFDTLTKKEESLFEYDYTLITTKEIYQKYFQQDIINLYFDIENQDCLGVFKQKILNFSKKYQNFEYYDALFEKTNQKIEYQQSFLKEVSLTGIMIIGMITFVYIHRKINTLALKRELGLYRIIGMTKKQIYSIYLIYGIFIYVCAFLLFLLVMLCLNDFFVNFSRFLENLDYCISLIFNPLTILLYLGLAILFISAILLPVYSLLKENILKHISTN